MAARPCGRSCSLTRTQNAPTVTPFVRPRPCRCNTTRRLFASVLWSRPGVRRMVGDIRLRSAGLPAPDRAFRTDGICGLAARIAPIPGERQLGATVGLTPAIPAKVGRLQGTCVVRPALHAWLQPDLWPKLLLEKSRLRLRRSRSAQPPGGGASCADRDARSSPTPGQTAAAASRRLQMHGNCFATLGVALVGRAVKSFASPA